MTALIEIRDAAWLAERTAEVTATGCVEWTGNRTVDGYGQFSTSVRGERIHGLAHRLALELHLGRPLGPGMCALHHCDNPPCCNPAHLFEGTRTDNNADKLAKGRNVALSGERNGSAKLTAAQVAQIRAGLDAGQTGCAIAQRFGVTPALISLIKLRKAWQ